MVPGDLRLQFLGERSISETDEIARATLPMRVGRPRHFNEDEVQEHVVHFEQDLGVACLLHMRRRSTPTC
jgi:hypothetical protein